MFWSDEIAKEIIESGKYSHYWVDDMKTPSGRVHVGALRGVAIHGLIHRSLVEQGKSDAHFSYVFNDMDPMDGFPHYLPEEFKVHMGKPLYQIPSPEPGFESMAQLYAHEFIKVFNSLGFNPEIIWSSQRYKNGDFDQTIRKVLDDVKTVRKLYKSISNYDKPDNWYPYQVICPQCGKVGSTITTGWDGKQVTFECRSDLVEWAHGCGHVGQIEPTGDNGKLMWKVDWAAHWKVVGITVEGAGKDHMTEHGSHDLSSALSEQVLDYQTPYGFIYEWFLARGGSKMSSSKGIGSSAREVSNTLPPELLRFLLVKTPYRRALMFDPNQNDSILQLFDDYDQHKAAYFSDPKSNEARIFILSQINSSTPENTYSPRFRDVVNVMQNPSKDVYEFFAEDKGEALTESDRKELDKRIKFAKIWLENYAPEKFAFQVQTEIPDEVVDLSSEQITYLKSAVSLLEQTWDQPDDLQQALYNLSKEQNLKAKQAFGAIYLALLGKTHGPKAAWLILENIEIAKKRFASINQVEKSKTTTSVTSTSSHNISLHDEFVKAYPTASIGYARISGINIESTNEKLETERQLFLNKVANLTTEELGTFSEIKSYRTMYKQMGVDWHSRRPSPEALLRRIATGKGLYDPINTCVDAYNLIVMKNRVSVGAFDAGKISTPVEVRIARGGETAFFIGDKEVPTTLKFGEVCYFDQEGPYNLDYNYRDANRSQVTLDTKDIWINTEGVFDISPELVQQTLEETITIIQKYCGGRVVEKGMIVASQL